MPNECLEDKTIVMVSEQVYIVADRACMECQLAAGVATFFSCNVLQSGSPVTICSACA